MHNLSLFSPIYNSDGSAKGGTGIDDGIDYVTTSGTLCFKHNETSKLIDVEVNKETQVG